MADRRINVEIKVDNRFPPPPDDKYAATRCRSCDFPAHTCRLLRMQGEDCCGGCTHPREDTPR